MADVWKKACREAEAENAKLRADLQQAKRREVSPEFLHKLDAVTGERDRLLLQVGELKKKLDAYVAILGAVRGAILTDPEAKVCPEVHDALDLDCDAALDLQRIRREVTAAAKALDQTYLKVKWSTLGLAGVRMQDALTALAACELARLQKGLPLEAGYVETPPPPCVERDLGPSLSGGAALVKNCATCGKPLPEGVRSWCGPDCSPF